MARRGRTDPFQESLELQKLAEQHSTNAATISNIADEMESRGISRQEALQKIGNEGASAAYARQFGFPNLEALIAAETSSERRATADRQLKQSQDTVELAASKELINAAAYAGEDGKRYIKAALDAMAKKGNITPEPEPVDPKKAKLAELAAKAQGKPVPTATPAPAAKPAAPAPTSDAAMQSLIKPMPQLMGQPMGMGGYSYAQPQQQQAQPNPGEAQPTYPPGVNAPLGVGGAQITPGNPSGNPSNPWAAGGLFANNQTHANALAMNEMGAANAAGSSANPQLQSNLAIARRMYTEGMGGAGEQMGRSLPPGVDPEQLPRPVSAADHARAVGSNYGISDQGYVDIGGTIPSKGPPGYYDAKGTFLAPFVEGKPMPKGATGVHGGAQDPLDRYGPVPSSAGPQLQAAGIDTSKLIKPENVPTTHGPMQVSNTAPMGNQLPASPQPQQQPQPQLASQASVGPALSPPTGQVDSYNQPLLQPGHSPMGDMLHNLSQHFSQWLLDQHSYQNQRTNY